MQKFATTLENNFDRIFKRELIILVVPIALQNLISAAVIWAGVVMLGFINQSALSAVSLAGQITFVLTLFYMGLTTGTSILTAQYWGKKDIRAIQSVFNIAFLFSAGISFFFFGLSFCFPDELLGIFTNDTELIIYGSIFLRPVAFSYLAMSFSQIYLSVLKSMENARLSAWISSVCLVLDIALSALCIFVLFPGMPEKAITGVAMATTAARFTELGGCLVHSLTRGYVHPQLPGQNFLEPSLLKDFLKYTLPVQGNFLVWGGALTVTATLIGHVSADMVAANSVASVVRNLTIVLCTGIASGGAVLVGKYLGNNHTPLAKRAGNRLNRYTLLFGVAAGVVILLMKPLVFYLVNLNPDAHDYLEGMLFICAYYIIAKAMNITNIGGIFYAGGDARFGFWCDTVVMWGIILPLSYLGAFVWHLPPVMLYAIICLDELIKLPATAIRYRQYRWLTNLTREIARK